MATPGNAKAPSFLGRLDDQAFRRLIAGARWRHLEPGEVVCREGEAGSELYLVLNGRLRVAVQTLEGARTLAALTRGDFFGEMALLTNGRRNASVSAVEEADLLCIGRELALELLAENGELREALGRVALGRAERLVAKLAA